MRPAGHSGHRRVMAADVGPLDGDLAINAVTIAELLRRSRRQGSRDQSRAVASARPSSGDDSSRYPSTRPSPTATASWRQPLVESGRQPRARTMDLLIAATAHAHVLAALHPQPR